MSTLLEVAFATDPGRVRSRNEDWLAADAQTGFAVLADGMGGHKAGDVASRMAVEVVSSSIKAQMDHHGRIDSGGAETLIRGLVRVANSAVLRAAREHPRYNGMGTTLVVALWHEGGVTYGHVGDSRLYLLRARRLQQLTRDHSMVQEQLERGAISREQARYSANRNVVTRAVGVAPDVEPEVRTSQTDRGDLYLLCSDGLTDMLTDEEICEALVSGEGSLSALAHRLIECANAAGGFDNISAVLVRVARAGQ